MITSERQTTIHTHAPAKLNLYLDVTKKREDGYHDILTVMQTIDLLDELTFQYRDDGQIRLHSEGCKLPPPEKNLVVMAARLLKENTASPDGADIWLKKTIPTGGGLGGGSSDCACTLKTLNSLWGCGLSQRALMKLAERLGSDVPFFLQGGTAFCHGRGERITPIECPSAFHYAILIPSLSISTRRVYNAVSSCLTKITPIVSIEQIRDALRNGDVLQLGAALHNSLSAPAFRAFPEFYDIMNAAESMLYESGATGVLISGSGSTILGTFETEESAQEAAARIRKNSQFSALTVKTFEH
jgi:4-diphosphocytidyl-2-C-methyl-D-erythritol kinase